MAFSIYIPTSLEFRDYIAIVQIARTFSDGYDRKDSERLRAVLAPTVIADYSLIMPELGKKEYQSEEFISVFLSSQNLGQKTLLTQHLLGQPYFKSVSDEEIVVEWQQVAGHGRGQIDAEGTLSKRVSETSNGMSYMEQRYLYIEREWKLSSVKPSILFETGDLTALRK